MDQAAEAHRYVESWRKTGNVVLTIPRPCRRLGAAS
jgi:hypothetical protein